MADKSKIQYGNAETIIKNWLEKNKLKANERWTYQQLLELDMQICGFLTESRLGEGVYYSIHTMIWLLKQLDDNIKFNVDVLDYFNTNGAFTHGATIKVSFESSKLPICTNPTTRPVYDSKYQAALPYNSYVEKYGKPVKMVTVLDHKTFENNIARTKVKAIAENTGLGHTLWLKQDLVLDEMQKAQNGFYNIAVQEMKNSFGQAQEEDKPVIVQNTNGTVSKKSTKKVSVVVEQQVPSVPPTPVEQPQTPTPTPTLNTAIPENVSVPPLQQQVQQSQTQVTFNLDKAKINLANLITTHPNKDAISILITQYTTSIGMASPNLRELKPEDFQAIDNQLKQSGLINPQEGIL